MYLMQGLELKVQNYLSILEDSTWRTQPRLDEYVKDYLYYIISRDANCLALLFIFPLLFTYRSDHSGYFSIMINSTYYRNAS